MYRRVPCLSKARPRYPGNRGGEKLLRLAPNRVLVTASSLSVAALSQVGLHVVPEGFDRFIGLLECVDSTATLLQTPLATQRAQAYRVAILKEISQAATNPQGPKVLHVESLKPLRVDGDQSIIDQWIRSAGGRNAAVGVHGNKQPVSVEQVLSWNPDIIIVGANAGDPAQLASDGVWSQLAAVKAGRVYRNPAGIFPWDRYSPELLLQVDWARQIVQTGHVDEAGMIAKMQQFYRQFYGITLRTEDARRMLAALPPE